MNKPANTYFIQSNNVLLSIAIAFFLTNCIELLFIIAGNFLSPTPIEMNILAYFSQSLIIIFSLGTSFRIFKNTPIYLIALSTAVISSIILAVLLFISSKAFIKEAIAVNFISSFLLIFTWLHLTQNLENKTKALKIGYFSYFIAVEYLSLIHTSLKGENHSAFLLLALIGYKLASIVFELMVKIAFKITHVNYNTSTDVSKNKNSNILDIS